MAFVPLYFMPLLCVLCENMPAIRGYSIYIFLRVYATTLVSDLVMLWYLKAGEGL